MSAQSNRIKTDAPAPGGGKKWIFMVLLLLILLAAGIVFRFYIEGQKEPPPIEAEKAAPQDIKIKIPEEKVIDYGKIKTDMPTKNLIEERKEEYGLDKGVDMIVKTDEAVKIGDVKISMNEIIDSINLNNKKILEKDIKIPAAGGTAEKGGKKIVSRKDEITQKVITEGREKAAADKVDAVEGGRTIRKKIPENKIWSDKSAADETTADIVIDADQEISPESIARNNDGVIEETDLAAKGNQNQGVKKIGIPGTGQTGAPAGRFDQEDMRREGPDVFGIYIVKPGDNLWDIHFKFLKDFFKNRNINISTLADEPHRNGSSSGVGKILKFSENIVFIYNIKEKKQDFDINLIQPLSKIIIYNMRQIFNLLDTVNYNNVENLKFDGDTLWIPAG